MYARARIAFVLKLYYLSTIFCQQQHLFGGRGHLTYPACLPTLIGRARYTRVRAYRAWDTYDGVLSAASKRQPSIQSIVIYVSGNERNLHCDVLHITTDRVAIPWRYTIWSATYRPFDDAVVGLFVDGISRDVQPKGCDVTMLNYFRRRHTRERVPNTWKYVTMIH